MSVLYDSICYCTFISIDDESVPLTTHRQTLNNEVNIVIVTSFVTFHLPLCLYKQTCSNSTMANGESVP